MDKFKDKCGIGFLLLFLIFRPISYQELEQRNWKGDQNQFVRQEVLVLRAGGQDSTDRISVGRKILLKNLFADWPERIVYQKEQEKFYKSARAKIEESRKIRIPNKSVGKLLTVPEKDALNYFNGTGFYKKYQNPKTLPNIFDTRQSFLLKMEDREVRENFLKSYNNRFQKGH
jgi:hypothetical protein